jgi:hypothetical protein
VRAARLPPYLFLDRGRLPCRGLAHTWQRLALFGRCAGAEVEIFEIFGLLDWFWLCGKLGFLLRLRGSHGFIFVQIAVLRGVQ